MAANRRPYRLFPLAVSHGSGIESVEAGLCGPFAERFHSPPQRVPVADVQYLLRTSWNPVDEAYEYTNTGMHQLILSIYIDLSCFHRGAEDAPYKEHLAQCLDFPNFGVSAQIGSGVVRGGPEVRFHEDSTRVRGFHEALRGLRGGASTKKSTTCCWGYHLSLFFKGGTLLSRLFLAAFGE